MDTAKFRKLSLIGALIMACFAILYWMFSGSVTESNDVSTAKDHRPTDNWKRRQKNRRLLTPTSSEEDDDEEREIAGKSELVVVYLRPVENGFMTFPGRAHFSPASFWPLPEDELLPDTNTVRTLEEGFSTNVDPQDHANTVVNTAEAEGITADQIDPAEDPWNALVALEVERLRVEDGRSDAGEVLAYADDILDANPDHPVADFARLYQLNQMRGKRDMHEEAWDLALDVVAETNDTFVVLQAIDLLTTLPRNLPLEPTDLDRILVQYDRADEALSPIDVSAFGVDAALRLDDRKRAGDWVNRFENATEDYCDDFGDTPRCALYQDNLDGAVAILGDRQVEEADTLAQALEIAAWQCVYAGHDVTRLPYRTTAQWEPSTWEWRPWTCVVDWQEESRTITEGLCPSTAFTECITDQMARATAPDEERMHLRLNIVR